MSVPSKFIHNKKHVSTVSHVLVIVRILAFLVLYLFQVFSDALTLMNYNSWVGRRGGGGGCCFHMVASMQFIH